MLIDEVDVKIKAGDGGDGKVHFYHDRHRPKGGPDGGNGGDGGSVYFQAVNNISKLRQFRFQKVFEAPNGDPGGLNQKTGRNGQDLVLEVPFGTVVTYDNGTKLELNQIGEKILIAKGGRGGKGNYVFRSATNQTPKEFEFGEKKPYRHIRLQLKLIADVGLIGLPNAGKTSLLNELTPSQAKVANYPFTTLEPNLGVTKGNHIIADIPGLIEGAADGKGLGIKFLKHIERTKILVHCIASDSTDPQKDYQVIRNEIQSYSQQLVTKPEIIVITKSDLLEPKQLQEKFSSLNPSLSVSIINTASIKALHDLITKKLT